MRHGQRAPLRTSLTPYTCRWWSVVKGRSDIYTRPLRLYIPSEVTWFHGEIPRLGTLPSLSLPFFFSSCFLSIFNFYLSLSFPTSVYSILPFLFFLLVLYYSISPFHIVQFISILFRFSLFVPFACDLLFFSNWTRIMSAWPLPLAWPFRFPAYHRVTALRAFSSSCFTKRTRLAWMEFYVGYARKNATTPGMNLDYGNAR